jgi:hypothetical protein
MVNIAIMRAFTKLRSGFSAAGEFYILHSTFFIPLCRPSAGSAQTRNRLPREGRWCTLPGEREVNIANPTSEFQYDVFLGHSAKDETVARSVAEGLPHHNEIAVDEFPKKMAKGDYKIQKLYDLPTYARQFTYRYNTARNHILQVFTKSWFP